MTIEDEDYKSGDEEMLSSQINAPEAMQKYLITPFYRVKVMYL